MMTPEEQQKFQRRFERTYDRLRLNPPSFIATENALRNFACALTALETVTVNLIRKKLMEIVRMVTEKLCRTLYQKLGYPLGKTRRGLKKWRKKQMKKILAGLKSDLKKPKEIIL